MSHSEHQGREAFTTSDREVLPHTHVGFKTAIVVLALLLIGAVAVAVVGWSRGGEVARGVDPGITQGVGASEDVVSGTLGAGLFGGTEMACGFPDGARVGDRIPCNGGTAGLKIDTEEGREIWLDTYRCLAREYLVYRADGVGYEYETSECPDGLMQGLRYRVTGDLEKRVGQWRNGKQRDEWWMVVREIERE